MFTFFKILWSIIKAFGKSRLRSIYGGRYYDGVEFFNAKSIAIKNTSVIEKGTRLLVIKPHSLKANICIENNCWIGRDVEIQTNYDSNITLDNFVSIQDRCKILGDVYIGQYSLLAPDVFLSSGNHFFNFKPALLIKEQDKLVVGDVEGFKQHSKKIIIGEDCWLGKNVMAQRGVNIGRGAIIAANSFVKKNVPPYEVWGGVPAKFLKKRLEFIPPSELIYENESHRPYFYMGFDHKNINDGLLSNNLSVCVLKPNFPNIFLFLHAKIINSGTLKIWIKSNLIFNKELTPGILKENIKVDHDKYENHTEHDLYKLFTDELKTYSLIILEFFPKSKTDSQGFSIYTIANDKKLF